MCFLPQLIKPFRQRSAQGTVKRASTLPGWRATAARVGNAWAAGAPGRGCQTTVIKAGCRLPSLQSPFFQRELEPQSTPGSFQQHTGRAAVDLSWCQAAFVQGTDREDALDTPGQPASSSQGQPASGQAHGISCIKLPRNSCPCLPGRSVDISLLLHVATWKPGKPTLDRTGEHSSHRPTS